MAVVVIVGVTTGVLLRRRSHDDVHSVQHYHRQLHTLEEMRAHPAPPGGNGQEAYPSPAFRVGSPTVRLTDPNRPLVPPVPPPPVPAEPVQFDDEQGGLAEPEASEGSEEPAEVPEAAAVGAAAGLAATATIPATSAKGEERAMQSINHQPRRLGAPLAAIGAVAILIAVLIITGLHTTTPSHHGGTSATAATTTSVPSHRTHHPAASTTTTAAPTVSAPAAATTHGATYQVADASYALALTATNGECWVQATNASGAVLFSGLLYAGQSHTVPATGSVTVIAGAPNSFSATVNGSAVSLPPGFQAPFTLTFVSPGTGAGTGTGATGNSGSTT